MIATITDRTTRKGFCGSENLYDYFVVKTEHGQTEIPCSDFPHNSQIGDRVWLDFICISSGYRWHPVRLLERKAA